MAGQTTVEGDASQRVDDREQGRKGHDEKGGGAHFNHLRGGLRENWGTQGIAQYGVLKILFNHYSTRGV
jgi:hypothetical protein